MKPQERLTKLEEAKAIVKAVLDHMDLTENFGASYEELSQAESNLGKAIRKLRRAIEKVNDGSDADYLAAVYSSKY